jgi:hypothetical protein
MVSVRRDRDGLINRFETPCMWQTPTSGGWANVVQPGATVVGVEDVALMDTEEGLVVDMFGCENEMR